MVCSASCCATRRMVLRASTTNQGGAGPTRTGKDTAPHKSPNPWQREIASLYSDQRAQAERARPPGAARYDWLVGLETQGAAKASNIAAPGDGRAPWQ